MIDVQSEVVSLEEAVVRVFGEVDMNTSPKLRDVLLPAAKQKLKKVTIDLGGVTYMDSSGIATLVEMLQLTLAHKGQLILKSLTPQVKAVFEIAHLTEVFSIVE